MSEDPTSYSHPAVQVQVYEKTYLGDGAYCQYDGYHFVLTTEDGMCVRNTVYLEPEVVTAFLRYLCRCGLRLSPEFAKELTREGDTTAQEPERTAPIARRSREIAAEAMKHLAFTLFVVGTLAIAAWLVIAGHPWWAALMVLMVVYSDSPTS